MRFRSALRIILLAALTARVAGWSQFFNELPLPDSVELTEEEKLRSTDQLFAELIAIARLPVNEHDEHVVVRETALEKEIRSRDRDAHHWLAEVLLTTADRVQADLALSLVADGYWPTGARYPDIAREAVIAAVERSLRREPGSADRELLVAAFLDIGQPGDFPLLEPFLEEASGPFGGSLFGTIYQVTARVIGTEEDLPALQRHAERWRKIGEHMPPGHRESQLSGANFALARIRDLEARLAEEKLAAEQPAASAGLADPDGEEAIAPQREEEAAEPVPGQSHVPSARHSWAFWIWVSILLLLLLGAAIFLRSRFRRGAPG